MSSQKKSNLMPSSQQGHMMQKALFLHQSGQLTEAEKHYTKLLKYLPKDTFLLSNLGTLKLQKNNLEDGIKLIEKSLEIDSNQPNALNNLGVVLQKHLRPEEAIDKYDRAIAIVPGYAEAYSNRGNALMDLNRFNEALESYNQAVRIKPDYALAYSNRGNTLKDLNRFNEALESYNRAIVLNPNYANAYSNRGETLIKLGQIEQAVDSFQRSILLNPNIDYIFGELLNAKMRLCLWDKLSNNLRELKTKIKNSEKVSSPFPLLSLIDDPDILKKVSENYVKNKYPSNTQQIVNLPKSQKSKIKIGYFSPDFRSHPVSTLTAEIYELHDREKFEIHGFYFGPDTQDAMNHRIKHGVDYFHNIQSVSDDDAVKLSRSLGIDIAIDLTGFTDFQRIGIFSRHAAPIQVSYIGYLGTMGADYYDYILADLNIIPRENQKFYTEKIAYLSSYQANDSKRIRPDIFFHRKDLGLPESGFIFCCFNNTYKLTPETFDSWSRILKKAKDSILLIYVDNEVAKKNLRKEISNRGINSSRLFFGERLPESEYLARYRVADLFLDTQPYNAGTTASDALWMGLPVLTLCGNSFPSRMASSLLNALKIPELITLNQNDYESLAIELAIEPKKLKLIKDKLDNNISTAPLFDSQKFIKSLESVYCKMYDRRFNGLTPDHIYD